jgi:hypothetical protein
MTASCGLRGRGPGGCRSPSLPRLVVCAARSTGAVEDVERIINAVSVAEWNGLGDLRQVREESGSIAETFQICYQPVLEASILHHDGHGDPSASQPTTDQRLKLGCEPAWTVFARLTVKENDRQLNAFSGKQEATPRRDQCDLLRFCEWLKLPLVHRLEQNVW